MTFCDMKVIFIVGGVEKTAINDNYHYDTHSYSDNYHYDTNS